MIYQTVEQLLADNGFLAWYHQTDKNQVAAWNAWVASSEENRLLAAEAVLFLKELKLLEDEKIGKAYKEDIWKGIESRIGVGKAGNQAIRAAMLNPVRSLKTE